MDPQPVVGAPTSALQFDTAEPVSPDPQALSCAVCSRRIDSVYHETNGRIVCSPCRVQMEAAQGNFGKAVVFALGAGFAGWAIYYGILAVTGFELALISILVGFMVGRAVNIASGGLGGRLYQALGVLVTYVACTMAYLPLILAEAEVAEAGGAGVVGGVILALILPFLTITQSPIGIIILAVGLWEAWRANTPAEPNFSGPHAVKPPEGSEPPLEPAIV